MLTKACLKKTFTRESKLQSSNCRTASRTSSKLKAETAPPFCRTSQNCSHFSDNKTRGSRLTDSEVCKFLQWVQVHGTRYTFAYRVFNTSLLPVRSTLFQPKMMQPKQILPPYEVLMGDLQTLQGSSISAGQKCHCQNKAQERKATS